VRAIAEALRVHKPALARLIVQEMGKVRAEAEGEVQEMIDMADLAVGQSRMLYGHTMASERPLHRLYEQWHPLGLVGVITAAATSSSPPWCGSSTRGPWRTRRPSPPCSR
jgi:aldehyde dehydrogenase (NAD+)